MNLILCKKNVTLMASAENYTKKESRTCIIVNCYSCVSRECLKKPGRQPMVPITCAMNATDLPFKHLKPTLMTDDIGRLATCVRSAFGQYRMRWNSFNPHCFNSLNISINLWHN